MDVIEAEKCMESTRRRLERADRALTAAMREMTAAKQAHAVSVANFDAAAKQMSEAGAILARAWRVPPNG